MPTASVMYTNSHESFVDLIKTLTPEQWSTPVECLPGWTVRDTLSHVCGVADDFLAGRMEGAPGDGWTAAQVERNRDLSVDELLNRWSGQVTDVGAGLDASGGAAAAFDCHSHEHDIRQALSLRGNRDTDVVQTAATGLARGFDLGFPLTIDFTDGPSVVSGGKEGTGVTLSEISTFELFRSMLGRRSASQVADYEWSGAPTDIETVLSHWFFFGPAESAIAE